MKQEERQAILDRAAGQFYGLLNDHVSEDAPEMLRDFGLDFWELTDPEQEKLYYDLYRAIRAQIDKELEKEGK